MDCPTQNNLQSFLANEVSANEREIFELHMAGCADCRSSLALMFAEKTEVESFATPDSLKEKVKNLPAKASKAKSTAFFSFEWFKINRLQVGFATVLMVCLGVGGIYFLQNQTPSNSDDVLRNGSRNKNSVQLLAPENDTNILTDKIEFRWSEMPNAKNYTLVLSDEKGDIIKEIPTEKTQFESTLSAIGLAKEKHYFWHVRIKFTDGLTAESETRKILVR